MQLNFTTIFLLLTVSQVYGEYYTGYCLPLVKGTGTCWLSHGFVKPCESKYYCQTDGSYCYWIVGNDYAKCDKVGDVPPH